MKCYKEEEVKRSGNEMLQGGVPKGRGQEMKCYKEEYLWEEVR